MDAQRAARDARLVARLDALTRAGRGRLARTIERRGGRVVYSLRATNVVVAEVSRSDLDALRSDGDVASLVLDETRQAHLDVTGQALSAPTFWNAGFRGGAVDVAVIDTGLYVGHGAFVGRAPSITSGVFHDAARLMPNYWDAPTDPDDYAGHGTFVAGVVFSQGDAANPSRRGLAYGLDRLYNVKAGYLTYPAGGSSLLSDLMAGVDWALTRPDPPEVLNYSYGARVSSDDDLYTQFWDGVVDSFGKIATISAGNSGPGTVGSPGMAYNVLCVANVNAGGTASREDDVLAASSSGGPTPGGRRKPDLAAPGTSLVMPSHYGPTLWARASGTSFSAPAVAGIAALLVDAGVGDPRAVKALLVNSVDPVAPDGGWDPGFGWGYVNGARALAERQQVVLASLATSGSPVAARFFERTTAAPTRATVAWHRHVAYDTGGWPSVSGLNNVDLVLYSRQTGVRRAASESLVDNVEHVTSPLAEGAVLAAVAAAPFAGPAETIALAHSGGFVARTGPAVAVSLSSWTMVAPGAPFTVRATIRNPGDLRGHAYEATLTLPDGYTLLQGSRTQLAGSLDPAAEATVSWTIQAPDVPQATAPIAVTARTQSYGFEWQTAALGSVTAAEGCRSVVTAGSPELTPMGGSIDVAVEAPDECAWAVLAGADWLTSAPEGGQGSAHVTLSAPANHDADRSATVIVAGEALLITQAAAPVRSYYLAEGSTRAMFTLEVAIANPNDTAADIRVRFLRPGAPPLEQVRSVAARSRITIRVDDVPGLEATDVSTVVDSLSGLPLAVERTMTWQGGGGHGGTAVEALSPTWYFAEGAQGFFDTYLLLANPGQQAATVTVTWLREREGPLVRHYQVEAEGRTTVFAGADPELVNRSFATVVASDVPIVAERSMYWSRGGPVWIGGHESAGVPAPATSWFLAEGATGPFFDEYLLVGNPNDTAAPVTFRWLLPTGENIEAVKVVEGNARLTIDVEREDPRLADTAVSTMVTSPSRVVVERAMYWPGDPSRWQDAHDSFGLTSTATRWALAEGRVGGPAHHETYILLANPSSTSALVHVTFLREAGPGVSKTVSVAAGARMNVVVSADPTSSQVPELTDERFGALVEVTNGVGIAVERAMYWNSGDRRWGGGTNAEGVKIP